MASQASFKTGLLIANLGSPDAPSVKAVRRYLQQFLMDPEVLDIPWLWRALLVYGPISLSRAPKSAHAYQSIWTQEGSPLVHTTAELTRQVAKLLSPMPVAMGMRYGQPSIQSALQELQAQGVEQFRVAPLYPQYATSSTKSSVQETLRAARSMGIYKERLQFLKPFYDQDDYLEALAQVSRPYLEGGRWDALLFSYHGIPERHLHKLEDPGSRCLRTAHCCDSVRADNQHCYRAQCFQTTRRLTQILELEESRIHVSFQSRLGRTPWIRPFTDEVVTSLARSGVKRLAVLCPSFVADCLETLEEIGIREAESFRQAGGEELKLIPCLNAQDPWIAALSKMAVDPSQWTEMG